MKRKKKRLGKFIWSIIILLCLGSFVNNDNDVKFLDEVIEQNVALKESVNDKEEVEQIEELEIIENVESNAVILDNSVQYSVSEEGKNFEIHYIDVGQADASLVICDGKSMLIDGGNSEDSSLIYAYLKQYGITEIEYMICTHVHEDHVGGLSGALNYARVKNVLCPTKNYDSRAFQSFVKYVSKQNREITIPNPSMEFFLGSAKCIILGVNTVEDDPNNSSIVMKIQYGETTFLFCGDAEQEVETKILDAGFDVDCTVLKIPHHGSDTSLSYRWLNEATPMYGVISVGSNNQYGHPNENTLSKLRDADVIVYRTDLQGHIVCSSDGEQVTFVVEKNPDINTLDNVGPGTQNENRNTDLVETIVVEERETIHYLLNLNTKKFHYSSCSSVNQMKEKNKKEVNISREELIIQGYSPCGRCNP